MFNYEHTLIDNIKHRQGVTMQDKLQIKINENLTEGLIIKNYKEMCSLLDESDRNGKSKRLQLDDWNRYFTYEKQGHKFIITNIFDEPLEKNDDRSKGNNAIYVKYIETLLLHLLSKQDNQTLVCSKNYLLVALGMTDGRYTSENARKILTKIKYIRDYELHEFDNRAYQVFHRILFSSLNNLKNRCLINWKQELHYEKISDTTGKTEMGVATEDEEVRYMALKREILVQMGYDHLRDIYFRNKTEEFYELLNDRAYDEFGWDRAYTKYRIRFTKSNVIQAIPITENQLNQLRLKQQKLELNGKIMDALNNNAQSKYDNMLVKYQKEYDKLCMINNCDFIPSDVINAYLPPKNYVEVQQMIAEELIRINDSKLVKKDNF